MFLPVCATSYFLNCSWKRSLWPWRVSAGRPASTHTQKTRTRQRYDTQHCSGILCMRNVRARGRRDFVHECIKALKEKLDTQQINPRLLTRRWTSCENLSYEQMCSLVERTSDLSCGLQQFSGSSEIHESSRTVVRVTNLG